MESYWLICTIIHVFGSVSSIPFGVCILSFFVALCLILYLSLIGKSNFLFLLVCSTLLIKSMELNYLHFQTKGIHPFGWGGMRCVVTCVSQMRIEWLFGCCFNSTIQRLPENSDKHLSYTNMSVHSVMQSMKIDVCHIERPNCFLCIQF